MYSAACVIWWARLVRATCTSRKKYSLQCVLLWSPFVPVRQPSHCLVANHPGSSEWPSLCVGHQTSQQTCLIHTCLATSIGSAREWRIKVGQMLPSITMLNSISYYVLWVYDHCHCVALSWNRELGTWADDVSSNRLVICMVCSPGHVVHTLIHRVLFIIRCKCKNLPHARMHACTHNTLLKGLTRK